MGPPIVRRATRADSVHAARIIRDALASYGLPFEPGPGGRDEDVSLFGARRDHDDFVAEDEGGAVVGVASVGPHGDEGVAWVSKMFVDRRARGRGLGRALLDAAHDAARARGYRQVGLRTRVVFTAAIALYEKAGYVRRDDPTTILAEGDLVYWRTL